MARLTTHNETIVDQHTQQARGYAALTRSAMPNARDALATQLGVTGDDRVLDLACGPGSLSLQLAPFVAKVTGVDLTPAMLDQARAAQAEAGVNNVEWQVGDATNLSFADATFDLVASRAAFHHFGEPKRVLSEMVRVCRPGGRVVVIDVTPDDGKTGEYDRIERMRDPSHGHAHSIAELRAMATRLGLGEPSIETRMSGPMPYAAVLKTSFPEDHTREELLGIMAEDACSGRDELGFRAQLHDGEVLVTYPMTTLVWSRR